MSSLTLYTNPWSRGRIARFMLEELGVPYDVEVMDFDGSIKSPAYLAINPMGKVPAIKHGDTVVTEGAAICTYLADAFPEKNLAPPAGSPMRGPYYRWLFFSAGPLEMALTAKTQSWNIDKKATMSVGCGLVEDAINAIETALQAGPWICGEQFTAADVYVGSYIGWAVFQKEIDPRPAFTDYAERVASRPAAKRANDLDEALGASMAG